MAAVSEENSFEAFQMHDCHNNSQIFGKILPNIKNLGANFVLFGDNVAYHLSKEMQRKYAEYNTKMLLSVGWVPMLNPIENVFLLLKTRIRALRMQAIAMNTSVD